MASTRPEAIRWDRLSPEERERWFAAAQQIARRESRRKQQRFGPGVLGIGVGFRTKGKDRKTYRELVIRVTVDQKLPPEQLQAEHVPVIPPSFTVRRRGVAYAIPTDVPELKAVDLQGRTRLNVRHQGTTLKGSICCLLRDTQTHDLFILSCKHVLGAASRTERCRGKHQLRIDLRNPDRIMVAQVARRGDLAAIYPGSSAYSLDAAIARVDQEHAVSSRINRKIARRLGGAPLPGTKVFLPAASAALRGEIIAVTEAMEIPNYPCGLARSRKLYRVTFPAIMEVKPLNRQPENGDSGSPLLTPDGTLIGMHFAKGPNGNGLAMPIKDIVRQTTFNRVLRLVSNHNL